MKILTYSILLFIITSCGYPDIDSVPDFNDTNLTKEELFDLCQLSSDVKNDINRCVNESYEKNE